MLSLFSNASTDFLVHAILYFLFPQSSPNLPTHFFVVEGHPVLISMDAIASFYLSEDINSNTWEVFSAPYLDSFF